MRWTAEAALGATLEASRDGILIGDAAGIRQGNAAALRLLDAATLAALQVEPAALIGRLRLRRERDGPLLEAAQWPWTLALAGQRCEIDLWASASDGGADRLLHCSAMPIGLGGMAGPAGALLVMADLTGEHQLHESDAELRAVTRGVRDYAIYTIDTAVRIASWHLGAELMKGYRADEAIGMPFARLFTPEDQACGLPQFELDEAARTGEYKGEGTRLRKDGSRVDVAVVLTALRGQRGELLGFLKLTQDISQRRRLELEREQMLRDARAARDEAERASHAKGEFLATISHELRTPLSAILGWAHVLERGVFDAETVRHGLEAISRNARLQVQLIDDLLDMNRIESGQLRLERQRIELGAVIASAIDSALPAANARGIGLRTVFSAGAGQVIGDAARLQQVVANLLNNAIKFTPEGGQVSVTLAQQGARAQIVVADTGQGFDPDFAERMFDRFMQQDATTTRRHGGLGIGLAIVRHLVQLHGGSVSAFSAGPGLGASFTVTLPTAAA